MGETPYIDCCQSLRYRLAVVTNFQTLLQLSHIMNKSCQMQRLNKHIKYLESVRIRFASTSIEHMSAKQDVRRSRKQGMHQIYVNIHVALMGDRDCFNRRRSCHELFISTHVQVGGRLVG